MRNEFVLFTFVIQTLSDIDCITRTSTESASANEAETSVECSTGETLVSCGIKSDNETNQYVDGSYITDDKCYAINSNYGTGTYAIARCCIFPYTTINCQSQLDPYIANDSTLSMLHCPTSYPHLLGCSAISPSHSLDGSYPGTTPPNDASISYNINYALTSNNCTSNYNTQATVQCCASSHNTITCNKRFGTANTPLSTVSCTDGYFLSGCSGWSNTWSINSWYIENDICYARSRDNNNVWATAICCSIETYTPTKYPTIHPSKDETNDPIYTSIDSATDITDTQMKIHHVGIIVIAVLIVISISIGILIFICFGQSLSSKEDQVAMYMNNPMVITIAIGDYKDADIDALYTFCDLDNDVDIKNLMRLFCDTLNYEMNGSFGDDDIKLDWNQEELVRFLFEKANELNEYRDIYDGLIVVISAHGLKDHIVTSDLKGIEKQALDRIFSYYYPDIRDKPRLFIIDAFDQEREDDIHRYVNGSIIDVALIQSLRRTDSLNKYEHDPDYRLCTVFANPRYFARFDSIEGSYLITKFVEKMIDNIVKYNNKYFLFNILDDIEIEFDSNDNTKYIKFGVNNTQTKRSIDDKEKDIEQNIAQSLKRILNERNKQISFDEIEMKDINVESNLHRFKYQRTNSVSEYDEYMKRKDKCRQCGRFENGNLDLNDGTFYCYSCWQQYA